MASFSNWKPYENYVASGGSGPGMVDGQFLSGKFTGLFVGPPRLASLGGSLALGQALTNPDAAAQMVYPVGLTQNFNVSHNRQFSQIFEIGSQRSYFISGQTVGQLQFGRVLYHGPSLLRVLYAYYQDLIPQTVVPQLFANIGAANMVNPHDVVLPPGYNNLYGNLASDLFNQPVGMLMLMRDSNMQTYGAMYFESCVIPNHNFATDSQGAVVNEQAAIQFERAVPISMESIELIT